jgi:hypothetical protein
VPCMPWRVIFPSSSSAWKALESCSSCVPCTQLDMIRGLKVCLWYKRLCLVHCLSRYPCPNCLRCPPPFGVAAFLPFFLNLHPAGLPLAFHCLLTFLPSSVTDPRLQAGMSLCQLNAHVCWRNSYSIATCSSMLCTAAVYTTHWW